MSSEGEQGASLAQLRIIRRRLLYLGAKVFEVVAADVGQSRLDSRPVDGGPHHRRHGHLRQTQPLAVGGGQQTHGQNAQQEHKVGSHAARGQSQK